jgi:predicted MFS family arabinose efflux permease
MTQPPVNPSPFDKIIKEAGKVTTKGGFAALNCVLLLLALIFVLFLLTGNDRLILSILIIVLWAGFAVFVFTNLKQLGDQEENIKKK